FPVGSRPLSSTGRMGRASHCRLTDGAERCVRQQASSERLLGHRTGFPSARQRHHHAAVHWGQHRPLCVFHTAGCRLPGLRLHPGGRCLQHVVPRLCFTRHSLSRRAVSRLCRHCRGSSTVTSIPSSGVLNMTLLSYRSRVRKHLSAATLALGLALAGSAPAVAATDINLVLNWKYEGAQAWFFLAED